jgi:hypothetical protein
MPTFFCEAIEGGVTPISLEIVADSQDAAVAKLNALAFRACRRADPVQHTHRAPPP